LVVDTNLDLHGVACVPILFLVETVVVVIPCLAHHVARIGSVVGPRGVRVSDVEVVSELVTEVRAVGANTESGRVSVRVAPLHVACIVALVRVNESKAVSGLPCNVEREVFTGLVDGVLGEVACGIVVRGGSSEDVVSQWVDYVASNCRTVVRDTSYVSNSRGLRVGDYNALERSNREELVEHVDDVLKTSSDLGAVHVHAAALNLLEVLPVRGLSVRRVARADGVDMDGSVGVSNSLDAVHGEAESVVKEDRSGGLIEAEVNVLPGHIASNLRRESGHVCVRVDVGNSGGGIGKGDTVFISKFREVHIVEFVDRGRLLCGNDVVDNVNAIGVLLVDLSGQASVPICRVGGPDKVDAVTCFVSCNSDSHYF
jgi:hypothetical protein